MKNKTYLIILMILLPIINLFFYYNPQPEFLGGPSNDGLPGMAAILVIAIMIIATIGSCVFVALSLNTKIKKTIGIFIVLMISFLPVYMVNLLTDSKYLVGAVANAVYENRQAGTFKDFDKLCEGKEIKYVIPPTNQLGNIPFGEFEYKCGDKIGFFDVFENKSHSLKECEYKTYNDFMRTIGSLKRKRCTKPALDFSNNYSSEQINLPVVDNNTKSKIVESKLKIYDVIVSKKPTEIRKVVLDFINYALAEKRRELLTTVDEEFVNEEIQIIKMKEGDVKSMSDKDLIEAWYSDYQSQYGSRTNFEKELQQSNYSYKTNTNIRIVLPQKYSGNNIDIRVMDSYLINGEWK